MNKLATVWNYAIDSTIEHPSCGTLSLLKVAQVVISGSLSSLNERIGRYGCFLCVLVFGHSILDL
jgi:hypothetical protein